jgi:hypothetical protein
MLLSSFLVQGSSQIIPACPRRMVIQILLSLNDTGHPANLPRLKDTKGKQIRRLEKFDQTGSGGSSINWFSKAASGQIEKVLVARTSSCSPRDALSGPAY